MPLTNPLALPCLAALLAGAALIHGGPLPARAQGPAQAQPPAAKPATPTGPAATAARPTIKQCADLWNELKAKNQTGKLVYRDFARECLAGTGPADAPKAEAAKPPSPAPATTPAAPMAVTTLAPPPPDGLQKAPDEADREAVNRCNGEWQAYKTRHNLSGAKAWHVFMARCLP